MQYLKPINFQKASNNCLIQNAVTNVCRWSKELRYTIGCVIQRSCPKGFIMVANTHPRAHLQNDNTMLSRSGKSVLIGFICSHINTSLCGFISCVLSKFNHFLILWFCFPQWFGRWYLLLLVWRWLRFRGRWLVFANAVEHQNSCQESSQGSSYKSHHCSSCNSEGHNSNCIPVERSVVLRLNIEHYRIGTAKNFQLLRFM